MTDFEGLFSSEIWPFIRTTVSIGVVAGIVVSATNIAWQKWNQRPTIEHDVVPTFDRNKSIIETAVNVKIFNRAPVRIRSIRLQIERPEGLMFQTTDGPSRLIAMDDIPPYAPGSPSFPASSVRGVFKSWPRDAREAVIAVKFSSSSNWISHKQRRISIRLPKPT